MNRKNEIGRTEPSADIENEKNDALLGLIEIQNNPTWKPQAKMSQVLAKIKVLRRNEDERIAND
jgi:hypothetical protein